MWFIDKKKITMPGWSKFEGMPESNTDKQKLLEEKIEMLSAYEHIPDKDLIAITIVDNKSQNSICTLYNHTFELAPEQKGNYHLKVFLQGFYKNCINAGVKPYIPNSRGASNRDPFRLNEFRFSTEEELDDFCTAMKKSFPADVVLNFRSKYMEKYQDRLVDSSSKQIHQSLQQQQKNQLLNKFNSRNL